MQALERLKLAVLMVLHLLWGLVLWFSISKLGLGLSTDSVHLLFAGTNLAAGRGLISFDSSTVLEWPPLYPALLALVHLVSGLDTFPAAHVLQVLSFLGLSVCLSIFLLRLFPDDFPLAVAGTLLSDVAIVVVAGFGIVGSDYVHLFLVVLGLLLTALYVEQPSGRRYIALFTVAMLAMLQRYLGISLIAVAALSILLWTNLSLRERLLRSLLLLIAVLPAGLWLLGTSPLVTLRPPASFASNFNWFTGGLLQWFMLPATVEAHPVFYPTLLWIVIALIALPLWIGRKALPPFAAPMLLFGLLYTAALFTSAALAYYNRIDGRFVLPLYVPLLVALLLALRIGLAALHDRSPSRHRAARLGSFAMLALLGFLLLHITLPAVLASHAGLDGSGANSFNTLAWHRNGALTFWRAHRPSSGSYLLLSNQPDGVAFHTQHACAPSPRRHSGPYGKVEYPVESYAASLFASGEPVYIVWIEPDDHTYYYDPADLAPIADIETLYSSPDGSVLRLTPKSGD
jgi:hypothetical protein